MSGLETLAGIAGGCRGDADSQWGRLL